MGAGSILKSVRKSHGASQALVAKKGKTFQPNVSAIEKGINDPSFSTLEECIAGWDYSLITVPTKKVQVSRFVLKIAEALESNHKSKAFRLIIQLNDDLTSVPLDVRVALCSAPAPSTGDLRYDALVAGLVEYVLRKDKLPVPAWVSEPKRRLEKSWVVDPYAVKSENLVRNTPSEFRKRNVLIKESEFASV